MTNRTCEQCGNEFPAAMLRCQECGYRSVNKPQGRDTRSTNLQAVTTTKKTESSSAHTLESTNGATESTSDLDDLDSMFELAEALSNHDLPVTNTNREPDANDTVEINLNQQVLPSQKQQDEPEDSRPLPPPSSETNAGKKPPKERIRATCSHCSKRIAAPKSLAGSKVSCPRCGKPISLPISKDVGLSSGTITEDRFAMAVERSLKLTPNIVSSPKVPTPLAPTQVKKIEKAITAGFSEKANAKAVKTMLAAIAEIEASKDRKLATFLSAKFPEIPDTFQIPALKAIVAGQADRGYEQLIRYYQQNAKSLHESVLPLFGELLDLRCLIPLVFLHAQDKSMQPAICSVVSKFGETAVVDLLRLIKRQEEDAVQVAALQLLEVLQSPKAISTLQSLLKSKTGLFRRHAVRVVAKTKHKSSVPVLESLLQDLDENVRMMASHGLAINPATRCSEQLIRALRDTNEKVRVSAIQALGNSKDKSLGEQLTKQLSSDSMEERMHTVEALGKLGSTQSTPALLEELKTSCEDPNYVNYTKKLVEALRRIRDPRAVLPLIELLEDEDNSVRKAAIEALGAIKTEDARIPLEAVLETYWREDLRAAVVKALGDIGSPESVPVIRDLLTGPGAVRTQALIALGKIADPRTARDIRGLLNDPLSQVRYQAAKILGKFKDADSVSELEKLVRDDDDLVRRAAIKSLHDLGDERSEEQIRSSLGKRERKNALKNMAMEPIYLVLGFAASIPGGLYSVMGGVAGVLALAFLIYTSPGASSSSPRATMTGYVGAVDISADGGWVAVARTRGMFEIWDANSGELISRENHLPKSRDIILAKELGTLVMANSQGVMFADLSTSGQVGTPTEPTGDEGKIIAICASKDRKYAAAFDTQGICRRWNIVKRSSDLAIALPVPPTAIALNADASLVATGDHNGVVTVLDWNSGEAPLMEFKIPVAKGSTKAGDVVSLDFSSDNQLLAMATSKGVVCIVEVESKRLLSRVDTGPFVPKIYFSDANELIGHSRDLWKIDELGQGKLSPISEGLGLMTTQAFCPSTQTYVCGHDEESPLNVVAVNSGNSQKLQAE